MTKEIFIRLPRLNVKLLYLLCTFGKGLCRIATILRLNLPLPLYCSHPSPLKDTEMHAHTRVRLRLRTHQISSYSSFASWNTNNISKLK